MNKQEIIKRFETRARSLNRQANILWFGIILLLGVGAVIFLFAAEITNLDRSAATGVSELHNQLKSLIQEKNQEKTQLTQKYQTAYSDYSIQHQSKLREGLEKNNSSLEAVFKALLKIDFKNSTDTCGVNFYEAPNDALYADFKNTVVTNVFDFFHRLKSKNGNLELQDASIETKSRVENNAPPRIRANLLLAENFYYLAPIDDSAYYEQTSTYEQCVDKVLKYLATEIEKSQESKVFKSLFDNVLKEQLLAKEKHNFDADEKKISELENQIWALEDKEIEVRDELMLENLVSSKSIKKVDPKDAPKEDSKKDGTQSTESRYWAVTVQTNVTRFGSLLIIIFLVNVLVAQYRYNIKLAAYYNARADALCLLDDALTVNAYTTLVQSLTPSMDFGKNAATPIDQVIELAKSIRQQSK